MTRLWNAMPALAGALMLVLAVLLPAGGASAATMSHAGHHQTMAARDAAPAVVIVVSLELPTSDAPCHQRPARAAVPCCVGLACVAPPVGIAADSPLVPVPGGATDRPATGALFEGVGVPPDLPPPRLG